MVQQKAKIDEEIKTKNKELQEFRDQLDKRAQEREEAEAKAKKERERLYALAHQEEKDEKQEKIAETEKGMVDNMDAIVAKTPMKIFVG